MKSLILLIGVSLFSIGVLANDRQEEMESELKVKLPYVTVITSKSEYAVLFANVTTKEVDCYILVENGGQFPTLLTMQPKHVSEPYLIEGHETKFKYACKFIRRT